MTTSSPEAPPNKSARTTMGSPALNMSLGQRIFMVAAGYVPFANLVLIVTLAILPAAAHWSRWTWCLAPAWLLIVPPIVVRLLLAMRPLPTTDIDIGSPPFLVWWLSSQ